MRCQACDCLLTDFESTRKSSTSGDFLDLCNTCLFHIVDLVDTKENFANYDPTVDDLDTVIDGSREDDIFDDIEPEDAEPTLF